jgi:vitellogenic carboxypeptidase-like protein
MGGMSEYNFRQYDYGDSTMDGYLERSKKDLGVPDNVTYISGNGDVYESFHEDITQSYAADLVFLLGQVRVLIYNGQEDYVVNTAGVLNYVNNLQWAGSEEWRRTSKQVWRIDGEVSGWAKVAGNLWFVLVNRAGHLVPTDNPRSAFSMFGHFIRDDKDWDQ